MAEEEPKTGIWLEVADVLFETEPAALKVKVQFKADKEHPKPTWWPVAENALGAKDALEVYKEILREIDKKRIVLARLGSGSNGLECDRFRFQSADLGSRT